MQKFTSPLRNIKVASPCSEDWNSMIGNDRMRFCGACEMNVYNLSGMTREEAESLVAGAEGRLCVRFYKRADGSVLTNDCPVGWARVRERIKIVATAFASLIFTFFGAIGSVSIFSSSRKTAEVGAIAIGANSNTGARQMPTQPIMGNVAIRETSLPTREFEMGKMAITQSNR